MPVKLLIVEDGRTIAAHMRDEFIAAGYEVVGVHASGEAAVQALGEAAKRRKTPDVVFMDIELAGKMDGIETAEIISREHDCAIIYLTGSSQADKFQRAIATKPSAYLVKPFDLRQAMAMIEIALYQRSLEKKLRRKQQESEGRYQVTFESSNDAILLISDHAVFDCNPAALRLFGALDKEELFVHPGDLSHAAQPDGSDSRQAMDDKIESTLENGVERFEWLFRGGGDKEVYTDIVMAAYPLEHRSVVQASLRDITDYMAARRELIRLHNDLRQSHEELKRAYSTTIQGWAQALELRDAETEGHSRRVVPLTVRMARALGVDGEELLHIERGAILHDVGKMGIPDSVLLKPGRLTDEEWVVMRRHPGYARDMLAKIPYLHNALDIPYSHHERWDGTGYPQGLAGEDIPLSARIFAIVDVWDALSSDRPYRQGWPTDKVMEHIHSQSGKHFDPALVELFEKILAEEA